MSNWFLNTRDNISAVIANSALTHRAVVTEFGAWSGHTQKSGQYTKHKAQVRYQNINPPNQQLFPQGEERGWKDWYPCLTEIRLCVTTTQRTPHFNKPWPFLMQ